MTSPSAPLPDDMLAWVACGYGKPEVLELRRVPLPRLGPRDLLIRVEATTVSAADRRIRSMDFPRGMRLAGRLIFGITAPRRPILGVEVTGIVAATGARVSAFKPGDPVIASTGIKAGGHANYVAVHSGRPIARRPADMTANVAAAIVFGGFTARDFLRRANVCAGDRVLVIGASGTVGSALVQLARHAGADLTAVTSTSNLELVRTIGAHRTIDYTVQDVSGLAQSYDIIADAVGALTFSTACPMLAEGGRFLAINGGIGDMIARPKGSRRAIAGPSAERQDDLDALVSLATAGTSDR